jgi:DNA-binding transcriptional ArsR family regulator
MSYLLMKERRISQLLPARLVSDPRLAQSILQPMRWRILSELSRNEKCASDLAKAFGASEQVICYHLRELERNRLVTLERTVKKRGATAKYYRAESKAIAVLPYEFQGSKGSLPVPESIIETSSRLLGPFISEGQINGRIVLGSPDPHGVFGTRARCGDRATDLALFLGSLLPLTREMIVRLDTEITQQEISGNLIAVGGPRVNSVTLTVNEYLPITYDLAGHSMISKLSGKSYASEYEGAIQLVMNPTNSDSYVLVIAGNSCLGTRAAVLAFIKYTEEIARGNLLDGSVIARVVNGLDIDSDGLVDDAEFLE